MLRPCVSRSQALAVVERLDTPFATPNEVRADMAALCRVDRTLAVRMGLGAVRGLGVEVAQAIVDARAAGPFESLADMARRVRVRPRASKVPPASLPSAALARRSGKPSRPPEPSPRLG